MREKEIGHGSQTVARIPKQTGRLAVGRKITLNLTSSEFVGEDALLEDCSCKGVVGYCCEWEVRSSGQGLFRNAGERECPQFESAAKQRLVKTITY
jgi:hypothetical protein